MLIYTSQPTGRDLHREVSGVRSAKFFRIVFGEFGARRRYHQQGTFRGCHPSGISDDVFLGLMAGTLSREGDRNLPCSSSMECHVSRGLQRASGDVDQSYGSLLSLVIGS